MTLQVKTTAELIQLLETTFLNIWFRGYKQSKKVKVRSDADINDCVGFVESWKAINRKAAWMVFWAVLAVFPGYPIADDLLKEYGLIGTFTGFVLMIAPMFIAIGFLLYAAWLHLWKAEHRKPDGAVIQLVNEYQRIHRLFQKTKPWNTYVEKQETLEARSILQGALVSAEEHGLSSLPEFLAEALQSRLHSLGSEVTDWETRYRKDLAARVKFGMFIPTFEFAKAVGVIQSKVGYDHYIPETIGAEAEPA